MYRAFNVKLDDPNWQKFATNYNYDDLSNSSREILKKVVNSSQKISADKIKEILMPRNPYDIFISHSHKDLNLAKGLAGYLQKYCKVSCFIDSLYWGKLVFTSEVVADFVNDLSDELIKIFKDLEVDKTSFETMGITYEEKAFYDILVKVRDEHGFVFADEKCISLAKEIKKLVDDKVQYADFFNRDDIKNQLNMDLTVLLYKNGYPPEWDEEVFNKVMEQAENFKKYNG